MILSIHTQRLIRNKGMAALYVIAAENDCDVSDVLDLLVAAPFTPSQPSPASQAPAARMSDPAPADMQAEGGAAPPPSADPSEYADRFPVVMARLHESEAAEAGAIPQSPLPGDPADGVVGSPPNPAPTPSAAFSPAPKRTQGRAQQVEASINEHPDWPDIKIAELIDCDPAYVRRTAARLGRELPSRREWHKAQQALTAEALRATQEKPAKAPEPSAPPPAPVKAKRPPAPTAGKKTLKTQVIELHAAQPDWTAQQIAEYLGRPSVGSISAYLFDARAEERAAEEQAHQDRLIAEAREREDQRNKVAAQAKGGPTLTERIRTLHQQHPNWTATMLAKELGAKQTSVSTILSQVRGKPIAEPVEPPQFSGRRQMVEHYGEIAKRLGKAS